MCVCVVCVGCVVYVTSSYHRVISASIRAIRQELPMFLVVRKAL